MSYWSDGRWLEARTPAPQYIFDERLSPVRRMDTCCIRIRIRRLFFRSMRILNTGQVKYPAYRRRMRILALCCDACVDADVCSTQYPPSGVLQRLGTPIAAAARTPVVLRAASSTHHLLSPPLSLPLCPLPSLSLSLSLPGLDAQTALMHKQMHQHSHRPCSRRRLWDTQG